MVTFFTTTKRFVGKDLVNQLNAISSWTIGNKYNCEAIIFQSSEGIEILDNLQGIRIYRDIECNENGVPYTNRMFEVASSIAKYNIVCFLNADIIIDNTFIETLDAIHKKTLRKYLIVGQRIDSSFDFLIDFNNVNWHCNLMNIIKTNSEIHLPYGSDFFAFPKGQYISETLPPLLVGRPGWDNYMIYHARKELFKLINLSPTYMVIHQDHDYQHKNNNEIIKREEDNYNYNFLPEGQKYTYILSYCNYKYIKRKIEKTYHNYDFNNYYKYECVWGKPSFMKKIFLKIEIIFKRLSLKITD